MQVGAIALRSVTDYVVDHYFLEAGDVAEGYGTPEEGEGGTALGWAETSVLMVGRGVIPAAEALANRTRKRARGLVGVEKGEQVGS